jgi:hypothetical protein
MGLWIGVKSRCMLVEGDICGQIWLLGGDRGETMLVVEGAMIC